MRIPSSLIQNFITSEFTPKLNSSGEYIIRSPFNHDTKGKLYINKDSGQWIDFKGTENDSGGFLKFVMMYFDIGYREAIDYLVSNYNLATPQKSEEEIKEENNNKDILREFILTAKPRLFKDVKNLSPLGQKAYQYILDRKLDPYYYPMLGYCDSPGTMYNERIFIPFYEDKKIVYGITRSLEKETKYRYINLPKLNSKDYVFNIDNVIDSCVICEGTMDAMSLVPEMGAVAMLSADFGPKQMEKLFDREVRRIIYVPDHDATGMSKMDRNIKKIIQYCPYNGLEIYVFDVPEGCKDLNDMKIKTGKNYILKKECHRYGDNLFQRSIW